MNKVVLVGRLTRDPELRALPNGSVATFTLAISRPFTNNAGEREADFINCVAFNRLAENLQKYIHKGSLIGVDGRIQTRNYVATDGNRRFVMEVICENVSFLEPKSSGTGQSQTSNASFDFNAYEQPSANRQPSYNRNQPSTQEDNSLDDITNQYGISDDDLPF